MVNQRLVVSLQLLIIAIAVCSKASSAHSQAVKHPDAQPGAVDFSQDAFLIGRWSCDVNGPDGKIGTEDATYKFVLQSRWIQLDYTLHSPSKSDVTTTAFETYDTTLGKWMYTSMGSDGSHGSTYSDGWRNGLKIYRPDESKFSYQVSVRKLGDREFTESAERRSSGDQMVPITVLHCRKTD